MAEALVDFLQQCLASITLDKVERELRAVVGVDKEAANINHNADQEKIKVSAELML